MNIQTISPLLLPNSVNRPYNSKDVDIMIYPPSNIGFRPTKLRTTDADNVDIKLKIPYIPVTRSGVNGGPRYTKN